MILYICVCEQQGCRKKLQLLAGDDLKTLFNIFQNLVIQLPKNRIPSYVIVDVSLYESTGGDDDFIYAWQRLNHLLAHKHFRAVFNSEATSPGQNPRLHEEDGMKDGDVLFILDEVGGSRRGDEA